MSVAVDRRWLVLRFEAPLLSFGGVAIDNFGVTWDFPGLSMLTGLFANALGWDRTEGEPHQALQDRMVCASRRDDEPYLGVLRDVQNVRMAKSDKGWTTRGQPEGRAGDSYGGPHRRYRDYHPDALVAVVVTLSDAEEVKPTLDDLACALDHPQRPLFIGRKSCLPSGRLNGGFIQAACAHEALSRIPLPENRAWKGRAPNVCRAQWPASEGPTSGALVDRGLDITDRRNWISGLHGGTRHVVEGRVRPAATTGEVGR